MTPNPLIGVMFHWLGGLASASFYVPYRRIQLWSWEIFWITGGIFSWVIAPWLVASIQTNDLLNVLGAALCLFQAPLFALLLLGGRTALGDSTACIDAFFASESEREARRPVSAEVQGLATAVEPIIEAK